jgi:lysophospholipase L1-like esterase
VPLESAEMVTHNNRIRISLNRNGYRDVEPSDRADVRPTIVFLGDSFTWGFEVDFDEMFVSLIRDRLREYRVLNVSHRGYGTDQELLLTQTEPLLEDADLVFLMFSENDISDNMDPRPYGRLKANFQLEGDRLVLTGTPVPREPRKPDPELETGVDPRWKQLLKRLLFCSHFLHDLYYRWWLYRQANTQRDLLPDHTDPDPGLRLTAKILERLRDEVRSHSGELHVIFIPSKIEIEGLSDQTPYQRPVEDLCRDLDIPTLDLSDALCDSWQRCYYRYGMHWNARGHRLAADAIMEYIRKVTPHD